MTQPQPESFSALDLVEAFHLGHAVSTLHELRILAALEHPSTAEALADRHGVDSNLLRGVLEYVAARTNLVRKIGARFAMTRKCFRQSLFLLELYAGAYRRKAFQLTDLLRQPSLAPGAVDRVRHARAFEQVSGLAHAWMAGLIRQLQFNYLLDLGCGPAALLLLLASQDPNFVGWGLEINPALCKTARANIRAARLGGRIKLLEGDSSRLRAVLTADVSSNVQTVAACQVANEMFGSGSSRAVTWLRGMRTLLPGRPLLLSDYYGLLGRKLGRLHRETLLHDYTQLISGQGVPPANLAEWRAIYVQAGCRLVHVIEDKRTTRFMHIVML